MNKEQANEILIKLWSQKAHDALASAGLELDAGHLSFSVNRLYYSCFYAVTALLLKSGLQFSRHSAVISEFNRSYVKTGKVDVSFSKFYQRLFDDRQEGDYLPTAVFEHSEVSQHLKEAESFVNTILELVNSD
jgi:uncharacterized protein (UPF0332 family)